jgi:hypothetical protein
VLCGVIRGAHDEDMIREYAAVLGHETKHVYWNLCYGAYSVDLVMDLY